MAHDCLDPSLCSICNPARAAGIDMVPAVPMEFGDPHEALYAGTEDGMREFAGRLPVHEAERTPEGARDRFRRRTQAALEAFHREVLATTSAYPALEMNRLHSGGSATLLGEECAAAAEEYRNNLSVATGTTPEALRHQTGC